MNLFDLALAITYEAHYQVEHADDDFVDEMMDAAEEGDFDADRDFLPEGGLNRRAWLDTGRDEVLRDDLLCEATPTTTYRIKISST